MMRPCKCDIFISYRFSKGRRFAKELYDRLKGKGYCVFADFSQPDVNVDREQIFSYIAKANDFVLILPPHALDYQESDRNIPFWKNIEQALASEINIVSIELEGFEWPEPENLPRTLRKIMDIQCFSASYNNCKETVLKLTKRNPITKRRLLKSGNPVKRKKIFVSFCCFLFVIFISCSVWYFNTKPVFYLELLSNVELEETLDSLYKTWDKYYVIVKKGFNSGKISIEPTAMLEIIVYSDPDAPNGRMGSVTINLEKYFENEIYYTDGTNNNSVSIPETKAHLAAEFLADIFNSLEKKNMFVESYALKIYFTVTYQDILGINYCSILEPDFNYDFGPFIKDEENEDIYILRNVTDTTLYKCKSPREPYITVIMPEHGITDAEKISQSIVNDKQWLLDKDSNIRKNDDNTKSMNLYYESTLYGTVEGNVSMVHAKHDGCVLENKKIIQ